MCADTCFFLVESLSRVINAAAAFKEHVALYFDEHDHKGITDAQWQ